MFQMWFNYQAIQFAGVAWVTPILATVQVSALAEGDRILIRPGEQVPIDGEVIEGTSSVNEAFLTGDGYYLNARDWMMF